MYSRGSRYFKIPPADGESDSALAELLSGNTLADQSSLLRWMLFVLVRFITSFHSTYSYTRSLLQSLQASSKLTSASLCAVQVRGLSVPNPYHDKLERSSLGSAFQNVHCPLHLVYINGIITIRSLERSFTHTHTHTHARTHTRTHNHTTTHTYTRTAVLKGFLNPEQSVSLRIFRPMACDVFQHGFSENESCAAVRA